MYRRSLNLIETLLNLAEQGHYLEVMSLFRVPIKQCPEVFLLGLLQCKVIINHCTILFSMVLMHFVPLQTSWQILQMEMLSHLIPMFFSNHPNASNILNFVWHSQVKQNMYKIFIHAMYISLCNVHAINDGDFPMLLSTPVGAKTSDIANCTSLICSIVLNIWWLYLLPHTVLAHVQCVTISFEFDAHCNNYFQFL